MLSSGSSESLLITTHNVRAMNRQTRPKSMFGGCGFLLSPMPTPGRGFMTHKSSVSV